MYYISGWHHVFKGKGRPLISIAVHEGRVKAVYIRHFEEAIRGFEVGEGED